MTHSLPPDVEKLLQDLQPTQPFNAIRKRAARELGQLSHSDRRIVSALLAAAESDPAPIIRRQAAQSLETPAQQAVLQQHPDLLEKVLELQAAQASQQAPPKATPDAPEQEPPEDAVQPASGTDAALLREIRSWGWWSLLLGIMHLLLPGLSVPWGIVLLSVGAASFYFREASMLAVYSVTLAWVGISNMLLGSSGWGVFAILQLVFAARVFSRFYNFRRAEARLDGSPDERRAARLFPAAGCILGAMSLGSTAITAVSLVLLFASTDSAETPVFFVWLADLALHLGVLGLAVNLAALLSGYRYRWLSVLGLLASLPVLLIIVALALF